MYNTCTLVLYLPIGLKMLLEIESSSVHAKKLSYKAQHYRCLKKLLEIESSSAHAKKLSYKAEKLYSHAFICIRICLIN